MTPNPLDRLCMRSIYMFLAAYLGDSSISGFGIRICELNILITLNLTSSNIESREIGGSIGHTTLILGN
jgi:hypothetical protein